VLGAINRIRLHDSFACLRQAPWDGEEQRLIPFRALKARPTA